MSPALCTRQALFCFNVNTVFDGCRENAALITVTDVNTVLMTPINRMSALWLPPTLTAQPHFSPGLSDSLYFFFKPLLSLLQYCFCFMFCFFGPQTCGILAPPPGIKPSAPALIGGVLTTGPPGKSLIQCHLIIFSFSLPKEAFQILLFPWLPTPLPQESFIIDIMVM